MISAKELLELKNRMLLAADAANHLANSDGEFLELNEEQFVVVHEAMVSLRSDCARVLAELDVLRGMFMERLGMFFMEGSDEGDGSRRSGGRTVEPVSDREDVVSGEAPRDDDAADGGRLHRSRAARKPRKRSKPKRDSRADGTDSGGVDAGTGTGQMDRSETA